MKQKTAFANLTTKMGDKAIPGKVFNLIGQLSFQDPGGTMRDWPTITEGSSQDRKIDLGWHNMIMILVIMIDHPNSQIISNWSKLIGVANGDSTEFQTPAHGQKALPMTFSIFIERYPSLEETFPINLKIMLALKIRENSSGRDVEMNANTLVISANAVPPVLNSLAYGRKLDSSHVRTLLKSYLSMREKFYSLPEANESTIEIAAPRQIVQLIEVLGKASVVHLAVGLKRLVILANAAPSALKTLALDSKPLLPNASTVLARVSFARAKVSDDSKDGKFPLEIPNSQQMVQIIKILNIDMENREIDELAKFIRDKRPSLKKLAQNPGQTRSFFCPIWQCQIGSSIAARQALFWQYVLE
jgi:hypothetical protein